MDVLIEGIILLLLLILSGYFSSTETALTTVSQIKLRTLSEAGNKKADTVLKITEQKEKMLSAILIGNNVVNLSASSLSTSLAIRFFGSVGAGVATGILTFLILIFGEIMPKNKAQKNATEISLRHGKTIYYLMEILTPLIFIINHVAQFFLRFSKTYQAGDDEQMTEEELRTIVDVSSETGVIETKEQKYIHNLFDFNDSAVREIMIPRIDVTMVDVEASYEDLIQIFAEEMVTRIPVFEGDPDHIIGVINMKDLLLPRGENPFNIRDYLREPYFTYEQKNISELFAEMRHNSIPMAIIQDEYGTVTGIVTLEDLLEELVGEIRDEYDVNEESDVIQISDTEYIVQGSVNLDDLNDMLPLHFESEDYDTIGGYLTGLFDHVPTRGETYVTSEGIILRVVQLGHQRIEKVKIRFPEAVEFEDPEVEDTKKELGS